MCNRLLPSGEFIHLLGLHSLFKIPHLRLLCIPHFNYDVASGPLNEEEKEYDYIVTTDASKVDDVLKYSYAVMVRDLNGNLINAFAELCIGDSQVDNPQKYENKGLLRAITFCEENKYRKVRVLLDCKAVIGTLNTSYKKRRHQKEPLVIAIR